jgi:GDPmannose 4,6-dehydratase
VKIYHASSAEIFGNATESPQTETTPLLPSSLTVAPKLSPPRSSPASTAIRTVFLFATAFFTTMNRRVGAKTLSLAKSRAVARIASDLEDELVPGNLESRRDWGRGQDYVVAMWLMLQHENPDDYVVATVETHSVRKFAEAAFAVVKLPWEKYVKHNRAFDRPNDPAYLAGSAEKIRATSRWQPTGSFVELLRETVDAELADAFTEL